LPVMNRVWGVFLIVTLALAMGVAFAARELPPDAVVAGVVNANERLEDGTVGADMSVLTLTPEDEQKLREGNYTAAIVMHVLDSSWSQQQVAGMKSIFDKYNVKVISVTGANAQPEVQMDNIESVIAMKPNVILSIPVDQLRQHLPI